MSGGVSYYLMLNQVLQSFTSPPILPPHSFSFGQTTVSTPSLEGAVRHFTQSIPAPVLDKISHGFGAPVIITNQSVKGDDLPVLSKHPSTEEISLMVKIMILFILCSAIYTSLNSGLLL